MGKQIPIAKAGTAAVSMAADYALEQAGGQLPADTNTLVRVGYLRRVPEYIEPILKAAWPWTVVKWVTVIKEPKLVYTSHPSQIRAQVGRYVVNRHTVYPLTLLEPFLEFLRPSGACHLAKIDVGLALDPAVVVDLDTIPKRGQDPDF